MLDERFCLPPPSQEELFQFPILISFINPSPPAFRVFFFLPGSTGSYIYRLAVSQEAVMYAQRPFFPQGSLGLAL